MGPLMEKHLMSDTGIATVVNSTGAGFDSRAGCLLSVKEKPA